MKKWVTILVILGVLTFISAAAIADGCCKCTDPSMPCEVSCTAGQTPSCTCGRDLSVCKCIDP